MTMRSRLEQMSPDDAPKPPIYMIDLHHEIRELRSELQQAFDRVLDSGSFI